MGGLRGFVKRFVLLVMVGVVNGCGNSAPVVDAASGAVGSAPSAAVVAPMVSASAVLSASAPLASASAVVDAGVADASVEDAGAVEVPFAKDNKVEPREDAELQERARGLFQAIVSDDPATAEGFWFPKEPFIPLKDVKESGKYWEQLHRTYLIDVHALHKKRKSWDGAKFVRFDRGSTPKWVKPGDEANKIGYHRSFHGQLRYEIGGEAQKIDVHTVITWQGRWFITHLRKFKK